jgi:hypothetical protein
MSILDNNLQDMKTKFDFPLSERFKSIYLSNVVLYSLNQPEYLM